MQTKIIENFIVTANSKSFADAAEKLFISVPALTKQISSLEKELGVVLLSRTNKGISLTEAGKYFLDNTQPILTALQLVVEKTQSIYIGHKNKIVIGTYGSDISRMIPSFFKYFLPIYPEIQLTYSLVKIDEIDRKLLNHEIDFSFIYGYNQKHHSSELEHLEIIKDDPICIVPNQLPLSKRESICLADLSDNNLLIVNYGNDIFHDSIHDEIKKQQYPINIIPVEEGYVDGQLKLTINPMIFIASKLSVEHANNSAYIPFSFNNQKITIGILFRKEDKSYIEKAIFPIAKRAFEESLYNW